jgi:hypothetical protein
MAYNLRTGLIGSGDIDINVSLSDLTAANITSGVFTVDRIPDMSANKITADTLDVARIPDISANKITSDTLHVDRIPNLDAAKITSGVINTQRIPTITNDHILSNSINSDKIKMLSGAFSNDLIPNIPASKVAPGEALTNSIDATLLEGVTVLSKKNNQTHATGGGLGCEGDFDCEGHATIEGDFDCEGNATFESDLGCEGAATFGSSLTDLCKIKGKLITSGGNHLNAEYPLLPSGYGSSYQVGSAPTVYTRKIQILASDFQLNDDQSYFNLSVYDLYSTGYGTTNTSGFGAIKTHSTSHEMFAFIRIPEGYNVKSYKIFGIYLNPNSVASQSFAPLILKTVTAYKVTFDNSVPNNMGSGYVNSEVSVNAQTFDAESYMLIEVVTTSQLDGILGGWVEIEPV